MKISTKATKRIVHFICILLLSAPLTVFAQDSMIVVPVAVSRPLKNVVTVSPALAKFTDPVAAVASITDASATNPYLVVIGPGVYTITSTLVMKEYVEIAGSGENVTTIKGAISTGSLDMSSAIISGSRNAALSSLTVQNTGGSKYSIALHNHFAHLRMNNVTAIASGGTSSNYGIYNSGSNPVMTHVTVKASDGTCRYCIYNYAFSSPTLDGVTTAAAGNCSYGVYSAYSSPKIRRSTIDGDSYALYVHSSQTWVSQSTILGAVGGPGTKTCVACDDGKGVYLPLDCIP